MEEFRVPTTPIEVELQFVDAKVARGTVFVSAAASVDSWISEPSLFFPFRPEGAQVAEIVAKASLVRLTFTPPPAPDGDTDMSLERSAVVIECPGGRFEGEVHLDTPGNQRRVLDYVNQPDAFLRLHEGDRLHLIQKRLVVRIVQTPS